MYEELSPALVLLTTLLGSKIPTAIVREDNSAIVQAIRKGYSIKLRHLARTPKLSLASLSEACSSWCTLSQTPTSEQLGDLFTKALALVNLIPSPLVCNNGPDPNCKDLSGRNPRNDDAWRTLDSRVRLGSPA